MSGSIRVIELEGELLANGPLRVCVGTGNSRVFEDGEAESIVQESYDANVYINPTTGVGYPVHMHHISEFISSMGYRVVVGMSEGL